MTETVSSSPYLVEFDTDTIIVLTTPDESELYKENMIRLTLKERLDFMSAESSYWDWQRRLRTHYRTHVRELAELALAKETDESSS